MYAMYGTYRHEDNEAGVTTSIDTEYSDRGSPVAQVKRINITGTLIADSESDMNDKINEMLDAQEGYGRDEKEFFLKFSDGSLSPHYLTNTNALGGVRVVSGPNFTKAEEVFGVARTYSITLEARYAAAAGGQTTLVSYTETIGYQGTGLAEIAVIPLLYAPPDVQMIRPFTPVFIVQSGNAVGFSDYPSPNLAISLYEPQLVVKNVNVQRSSPVFENGSYRNYGIQWSYQYVLPAGVGLSNQIPPLLR